MITVIIILSELASGDARPDGAVAPISVESVEKVVREARNRGLLKSESTDATISEVIFYVFAADVRRWQGQEKASITSGLDHLRALLAVVIGRT